MKLKERMDDVTSTKSCESSPEEGRRVTRGQLARNSKNTLTPTPVRVMKRKSNSGSIDESTTLSSEISAKKCIILEDTSPSSSFHAEGCNKSDMDASDPASIPTSRLQDKVTGSRNEISTGKENGQIVRLNSGKLVRVIAKPSFSCIHEDGKNGAATATVTVSKPLDLTDILGKENNGNLALMEDTAAVDHFEQASTSHEDDNHSHSGVVTDVTCTSCVSQLPTIRKSLGRLELRLDTMMGLVRSLINRTTIPSSNNPVMSNYNSKSVNQSTSCNNNAVNIIRNPIPTRIAQANIGSGGVQLASPRIANTRDHMPSLSSQPYRIPSAIAGVGNGSAVLKKGINVDTPRSGCSRTLASAKMPIAETENIPNNPAVLVKKLFKANRTNFDGPVAQDASNQKKKIAKALLLFAGSEFSYKSFMNSAPSEIQKTSKKLVHSVIIQLMEDNLLYTDDPETVMPTDSTILQKEKAKNNLKMLRKYDICLDEYLKTLLPLETNHSTVSVEDVKEDNN